MAEQEAAVPEVITTVEVLERLADVIDGSLGIPERVEITRQSDVLYVCRVYPLGEKDYEGFSFEL